MGFWVFLGEWLHEWARDKTKDEFFLGLGGLGIPAKLMPDGAWEERVKLSQGHSLGIIAIRSGPIHWVSVLKYGADEGDNFYYAAYGVPDARLAEIDLSELNIKSVLVRDFPFVGRVCDTKWEGQDLGLGLLSTLNSLRSVNSGLVDSEPIELRAHRSHRCWTLTIYIRLTNNLFSWVNPPKFIPSLEEWRSYEAIASSLLHADLTRD
jgi:hypothetical protein